MIESKICDWYASYFATFMPTNSCWISSITLSILPMLCSYACTMISVLQFRVLHVFRPIVLDGHRFQRVEKRIVVQTVHFVRIVLRAKTKYTTTSVPIRWTFILHIFRIIFHSPDWYYHRYIPSSLAHSAFPACSQSAGGTSTSQPHWRIRTAPPLPSKCPKWLRHPNQSNASKRIGND